MSSKMASSNVQLENETQSKGCKRCKTPAQTGLKCVSCGNISHISCIKLLKNVIKVIDDKHINCCEIEEVCVNHQNGDTSNETSNVNKISNISEVEHLREIINQKDCIIISLQEQMSSMKKQLLLYEYINVLIASNDKKDCEIASGTKQPTAIEKRDKAKQLSQAPVQSTSTTGHADAMNAQTAAAPPQRMPETQAHSRQKQMQDKTNIVTTEHLNTALLQAQSANKCSGIINLVKKQTDIVYEKTGEQVKPDKTNNSQIQISKMANGRPQMNSQQNRNGKQINTRKKQQIIIGKSDSKLKEIKSATKKVDLFVSRVHPETCDNMKQWLVHMFKTADCERLIAKYPHAYASFKVTVEESNLEKALNPDTWPTGLLVSRFFRKNNSKQTPLSSINK